MNQQEKNTISQMIRIYCRAKHGKNNMLCSECQQLKNYAFERLEHCPFGENKPVCKKCTIHCYKPTYKEKIKEVMKFSGLIMIFYHPGSVGRYFYRMLKDKLKKIKISKLIYRLK